MRKSKIAKFLALATLLLATFSFIACGGNGAGGGDDAGGGNSGNAAAGGIPSSEQVSAKLKTLDYDIVVEIVALGDSEAMSMEMARKGNIYWFDIGEMAMAYKLAGDTCYYYMRIPDESGNITWMYVGEDSADSIEDAMENYFDESLFAASNIPVDLVNAGSAVVAGRRCTKYTWSDSAAGATVSETVYIDNETGLCLKLEASDSVNGQSEGASFEVKSFKTGDDVVAPVLPDPAQS